MLLGSSCSGGGGGGEVQSLEGDKRSACRSTWAGDVEGRRGQT